MPAKYRFFILVFRFLVVWTWILMLSGGFLLLIRRLMDAFTPQNWQQPVVGLLFCLISVVSQPIVKALFRFDFSRQVQLGVLFWATGILYLSAFYLPNVEPLFFLILFVFSVVHFVFWLWSWDLDIPRPDSKPSDATESNEQPESLNGLEKDQGSFPASSHESVKFKPVKIEFEKNIQSEEDFDVELEESEESDFPKDTTESWVCQKQESSNGSSEDLLSGWMRIYFAPNQQTQTVNIPFVPPFKKTPTTNCYQLQGIDARLEIAQNSPHGARIEIKLAQISNTPQTIIIEISALGKRIEM